MSFLLLKVRSNSDMKRAICKGALRYGSSEVQKGLKSAVQKNARRHLVRSNSLGFLGCRLASSGFVGGGFFFQNCDYLWHRPLYTRTTHL